MSLSLADVAKNPLILTFKATLPSGEAVLLRPLECNDVEIFTKFLENLSLQTREFYNLESYDVVMAKELCDAINRYDKLRFVAVSKATGKMIALFEYSFGIPENDRKRFLTYIPEFNFNDMCRVGPCISDDYQNRGVGSTLFPFLIDIASQFGKKQMILWGGVLSHNKRAINFYRKNGFRELGTFKNNNKESIDMITNVWQEK